MDGFGDCLGAVSRLIDGLSAIRTRRSSKMRRAAFAR